MYRSLNNPFWQLFLLPFLILALTSCEEERSTGGVGRSITSHVHALNAPQRLYLAARWSPDSRMIAAIGWRRASATDVVQSVLLMRADGTLIDEITSFPGQTWGGNITVLAWRSDGLLTIAVDLPLASERWVDPKPDRTALFLIDPQQLQQPPRLMRANLAPITAMDWSPDGQQLLLEQDYGPPVPAPGVRYSGLSAYDLPTDTLRPWQFHDSYLVWPRWRPDGQAVMYVAVTMPGQRAPEDQTLVIRSWPTSHSERTSLGPDCGLFQPIWSANGQRIIYQELCVYRNRQSVNHLVVASPTHPLD